MNYGVGDIVIVTACMKANTTHNEKYLLPTGKNYVCQSVRKPPFIDNCVTCGKPAEAYVRVFNDKLGSTRFWGYHSCCFTLAPRPEPIVKKVEVEEHV